MTIGRGPLLSLRRRVTAEITGLQRRNPELRRARYSWLKRLLRSLLGSRTVGAMVALYLGLALLLAAGQAAVAFWRPGWLRTAGPDDLEALRDIGSYLLGGQLTVLGVVSVAVSIVTLLAQRTEGASARTETRLYYVEALAYELVTSGISLSLMLAVQLFWPLQAALARLGLGGDGVAAQTVLTIVHAIWLMGNLGLFFHFMMTTLRFVEPNARAGLRERYSANAVIPSDLKRRLTYVLYLQLDQSILGDPRTNPGPSLSMAHSRASYPDAQTEITRTFRRPTTLVDVWERPLAMAVKSWSARVRTTPAQPRPFEAEPGWRNRLVISLYPGGVQQGSGDLVLRVGATPLTSWERFLIRLSLRFAPAPAQTLDLPTPQDMLEELVDQVVGQIDRAAVTGFKSALSEVVQFHRFLLAAQHHSDGEGGAFNFAAIGGLFQRPDAGWIVEYQRLYDAAAMRLGEDPTFIDRLAYLPQYLMPEDASDSVPEVVADFLDLGVYAMLALQKWVQAHATLPDPAGAPSLTPKVLTGVDRDSYQRVVVKFAGAWETLIARLDSRFKLEAATRADVGTSWSAHGRAWRFVQTHLWSTAMMLAITVRSDDEVGAGWLRDVILRWPDRLDREDHFARLQRRPLLRPDWLYRPYDDASAYARRLAQAPAIATVRPQDLFSVMSRAAHLDAVLVTAAVVLLWHVAQTGETTLAGETARRLLRREVLPEGGRELRGSEQTVFRDAFLLFIRTRFDLRPAGSAYLSGLDSLVRAMRNLREAPAVPGRVYTGWGPTGVESLDRELLTILAAFVPETGDAGIVNLIAELASDEAYFEHGDNSVQGAISQLESLAHQLGPALVMTDFTRALAALAPDSDPGARRARLAEVLAAAVAAMQQARLTRLVNSPLAPARVAQFAAGVHARLSAAGFGLAPLRAPAIVISNQTPSNQAVPFHGLERGLFTEPPRAAIDFDEVVRLTADEMRSQLARQVRLSQWRKPKSRVRLKASRYPTNFWRAVARHKANVDNPVLVVPHGPAGLLIAGWLWGYGPPKPEGLSVEQREGEAGDGANYEAHVDDLPVYGANMPPDRALLFSADALQALRVAPQDPEGHWVGVAVEEEAGTDRVTLRLTFGLEAQWDASPVVEFRIDGLTEETPED